MNHAIRRKLYNAFGYVVVIVDHQANDIDTDDNDFITNNTYSITNRLRFDVSPSEYVDKMYAHVWLVLDGSFIVHNMATGSQITRQPGDTNLITPMPFGTYVDEHVGPSKKFFISGRDNRHNNPILPPMTYFGLKKGEVYTATQDTKLFLGIGTLLAGSTKISEPGSIVISSGKSVQSEADCHGVIFNI